MRPSSRHRPPHKQAINNVRGWWGENVEGSHASVGDEFTYRVQDVHYSKLRVIERIPNEKVVWLVLENHLNFVEDQTEWVGTTISFDIVEKGNQTEVRFTPARSSPVGRTS